LGLFTSQRIENPKNMWQLKSFSLFLFFFSRLTISRLPHLTEKEKIKNLAEIGDKKVNILNHISHKFLLGFLSLCDHENIVKFFGAFLVKEREVWLVTEYVPGGTLSSAIKLHKFPDSYLAHISQGILRGIKYLHDKSIIHGDFKASNIMLAITGSVKLIDMGLCMEVKGKNGFLKSNRFCGTCYYAAPEMIMVNAPFILSFPFYHLFMFLRDILSILRLISGASPLWFFICSWDLCQIEGQNQKQCFMPLHE